MTNFWFKRQYAESSTEPDGLAKRGYVYLLSEFFTLGSQSTTRFGLSTNGSQVEFQFYEISSSLHPVKASLIEDPTVTKTSSAIVGRNLNRNNLDAHTASFWTTATHTGGVVISSELVGSGSKAGGHISSVRIHTLLPEQDYLMVFENLGNQSTLLHLTLGWAEGEPGPKALWTT
jgi:hypothetical protein